MFSVIGVTTSGQVAEKAVIRIMPIYLQVYALVTIVIIFLRDNNIIGNKIEYPLFPFLLPIRMNPNKRVLFVTSETNGIKQQVEVGVVLLPLFGEGRVFVTCASCQDLLL